SVILFEIDSHLSLSLLLLIFSRLSGKGSITIPCHYHHYHIKHLKYLCIENHFDSCSPHTDPPKSTNKASISDDINQLTFTLTMTDLEPEDSGRYRCAVINCYWPSKCTIFLFFNLLELQPEVFSVVSTGAYRVSVKTGGSTTIPCRYDLKYKTHVKYLCKLDYLKRCSPDVHTKSIDKASVYDDTNKQTFTVTMSDLEPVDSGRYWCAVEIIGGSNVMIERIQLSVTPGKIPATIPYDYMTGVLVTFTGFTIELTYGMLVYVYFCSLYIISSL
uniref:Ig-like domain-containing protein n=1 Tax=Salmo trutta TaxID=8032 RepID=A0A673WD23_SALTR